MILKIERKNRFGQCLKMVKNIFVIRLLCDSILARFLKPDGGRDMMYFGPRDKSNEVTDAEELQIIEAFAEAEEYLDTEIVDDFFFDTED